MLSPGMGVGVCFTLRIGPRRKHGIRRVLFGGRLLVEVIIPVVGTSGTRRRRWSRARLFGGITAGFGGFGNFGLSGGGLRFRLRSCAGRFLCGSRLSAVLFSILSINEAEGLTDLNRITFLNEHFRDAAGE